MNIEYYIEKHDLGIILDVLEPQDEIVMIGEIAYYLIDGELYLAEYLEN